MFLYLFLLSATLTLTASPVKDRLGKAKNGDYIVAETNKMITLLAVRASTPKSIVLEEISAPLYNLKEKPASWADWVTDKAPGHTSWSMVEIDPETGNMLECYSFSRASWVQASSRESLIATLLQLPLKQIEEKDRKRIGSPPQEGEVDHRQVWNPPLTFEGIKWQRALFDAFETTWPKDGTELSGKTVQVYFDREGRFPFPYWIQVETSHVSATFRVIDAGRGLPAPYRSMPRRVPEFVGSPQKTKNGLRLILKSPSYYRSFDLFAVDVTSREKQIFPINHSLLERNGESLILEIEEEHLKEVLEKDHRYTWLLVPQGHSESYTETTKPFTWTNKH